MARKSSVIKTCMITQQLDVSMWDWTDDELKAVENHNMQAICDVVMSRFASSHIDVEEMYAIIHDKDTVEKWNEAHQRYEIITKQPHIHIVVKFADRTVNIENVAVCLGLKPEFVEKPTRGKYAYSNMLAYLIHIKYTDKHQYDYTEVLTVAGIPYSEVYHNNLEMWEKGRAKVDVDRSRENIDWLEAKILSGEVSRSQVFLTDDFFKIYSQYKRRCDDAFSTYAERKAYKTIQAMENGEFKLTVLFITGASRSGKSKLTDRLVQQIIEDAQERFGESWSVAQAAASNPFDDYLGEEILVMDDLRGMALTASDWLKLMDADRVSINSARYRNKRVAVRAIVINSEKEPLEFFYYLKGNGSGDARAEAMDQFFGRIMACVHVFRVDSDADSARVVSIEDGIRTSEPYMIKSPDNINVMSLNYRFEPNPDKPYYQYDEAIKRLSDMVISRNGLEPTDNSVIQTEEQREKAEFFIRKQDLIRELRPKAQEIYDAKKAEYDELCRIGREKQGSIVWGDGAPDDVPYPDFHIILNDLVNEALQKEFNDDIESM